MCDPIVQWTTLIDVGKKDSCIVSEIPTYSYIYMATISNLSSVEHIATPCTHLH